MALITGVIQHEGDRPGRDLFRQFFPERDYALPVDGRVMGDRDDRVCDRGSGTQPINALTPGGCPKDTGQPSPGAQPGAQDQVRRRSG